MIKVKNFLLLIPSALLLAACTTTAPVNNTNTPQVETPKENKSLSSSLRELMVKGTSTQCKYDFTDPETKAETIATVYISGEKFAQDVEIINPSDTENPDLKMSMISDGTSIYTWNPSKKDSGMKLPIEKNTDGKSQDNSNLDLDKKMDMNCSPWTYNSSKFTIPTDVKFTDYAALMKNIPTMPAVPTIPAK